MQIYEDKAARLIGSSFALCFCYKVFKIIRMKRDTHNALIIFANEIDPICNDVVEKFD